ncbi:MAG TPA: 16S rRNA (cytosine(1402)-N(4))-methyltransferase [Verrucomicrobia bacterium]|nr:16S rRNA (cytosine(1402)-N(4))-methyltransferase [Verrucomicrobiota bacterium]
MAVFAHKPVLLEETVRALRPCAGKVFVDGTLGRAGHAAALLAAGARVIGIDRDGQALEEIAAQHAQDPDFARLMPVKGTHGDIAEIVHRAGFSAVDGILLDLGVSSPQLDEGARGFSFMREGPLDMRMDRTQPRTAADILRTASEEELAGIFRRFGEEPQARRLARALAAARAKGISFETTTKLADFISRAVGRHGAHHPATRVFQALRMAVNDEFGELQRALEAGLALLKPGGRFAVITFESLTDRAVKRFFAAHEGRMVSLQGGGAEWEGDLPRVRLPDRKPIGASAAEIEQNPRARSAKLRVAEMPRKEESL